MYLNNIFFIFQKLFLTSAHQNNLKIHNKNQFKNTFKIKNKLKHFLKIHIIKQTTESACIYVVMLQMESRFWHDSWQDN
jgi:hypothetical protein